MGAITGLLGIGSGPGGTSVDMNNGTNGTELAQSYNGAQSGLNQQQQLLNALQGQNGIGNQSSVYNQLQGVASGTGPNPAQDMLNQATGQNVANQASLAAGQRGAAQNVGLLSRQAANQGMNAQQQAAGQGATMQANQSLGALQQLGGIANNQVAQQTGATNALSGAQQAEQAQLQGAQANYNNAQSGVANAQASGASQFLGKLLGGGAQGAAALAQGGTVPSQATTQMQQGPQSHFGQYLSGAYAQGGDVGSSLKSGGHVPGTPTVGGAKNDYSNDTISAKLSPGEIVLPRSVTMSKDPVKASAAFVRATLAKKGRK